MLGVQACSCNNCLPCLINRRRVWSHRILLESFKHADSCFVTLTYDEANLPEGNNLVRKDPQDWLKRLRRLLEPAKIRYFLAGEYGDESGRPHYHVAVFGLNSIVAGGDDGRMGVVRDSWHFGHTFVGDLTWESAQYIAGYVTKKLVSREVPNGDRVKEYCRMSLRPGIGAWAMQDVARVLSTDVGLDDVSLKGDVPGVLRHGKRFLPLGRYLRRRLRGELGFGSQDVPNETKLRSMRELCSVSQAVTSLASLKKCTGQKIMLDINSQKFLNMESKFRIRESGRTLR